MLVFSFLFPGMLVDRFDNHGLALYLTGGLLLSSTVIEVFLKDIKFSAKFYLFAISKRFSLLPQFGESSKWNKKWEEKRGKPCST